MSYALRYPNDIEFKLGPKVSNEPPVLTPAPPFMLDAPDLDPKWLGKDPGWPFPKGPKSKSPKPKGKDVENATPVDSEAVREQMQALIYQVKDECGVIKAKSIVKKVGGVDKMFEITPDKYIAVMKACRQALDEADK